MGKPTTDDVPSVVDKSTIHEINKCCADAIHFSMKGLEKFLEAGALLRAERDVRPDDFSVNVGTKLIIDLADAEFYINFCKQPGIQIEQVVQGVEMKLPRLLELLGIFIDTRVPHAMPATAASETEDDHNKGEVPKKKGATGTVADNAKPAETSNDSPQLEITDEQRRFLLRRSPKLLSQARKGILSIDEAIHLAEALPERVPLQRKPR